MKGFLRNDRRTGRFAEEVLLTGALLASVSYRAVPDTARADGPPAFFGMWFLLLIFGVCTTPRSKQTPAAMVGILSVPLALNFLRACHGGQLPRILALCLLCVCGYTVAVCRACGPHIRGGKYRGKWPGFFRGFFFRVRGIISVILVSGLLILGVGDGIAAGQEDSSITYAQVEPLLETVGNRTDVISRLDAGHWAVLSAPARLSTLQAILDIECGYLGIPYPLTVAVEEMEQETTLGYYSHQNYRVCINQKVFERASGEFLLSILLHEAYHAYERGILDLYRHTDSSFRQLKLFERAPVYDYEIRNYISGQEDPEAYAAQALEEDSRAYASGRIRDYLEVLQYLQDL